MFSPFAVRSNPRLGKRSIPRSAERELEKRCLHHIPHRPALCPPTPNTSPQNIRGIKVTRPTPCWSTRQPINRANSQGKERHTNDACGARGNVVVHECLGSDIERLQKVKTNLRIGKSQTSIDCVLVLQPLHRRRELEDPSPPLLPEALADS